MSKTPELLAKLKALASKAGELIYERIKLAAAVLADGDWLESAFQGDGDKARKMIEDEYFPELGKSASLSELLTLIDEFPDKAEWAKHKYNVRRLWAQYLENHKAEREESGLPRRKRATADQVEELETKIQSLEWDKKAAVEAQRRVEGEVEKLRRENDELRGEIKALNRMLEQVRQGRSSLA